MFIFHDNNLQFMLLSGIFFVSLHHQSNRMTMFKKTDPNPQLLWLSSKVLSLSPVPATGVRLRL